MKRKLISILLAIILLLTVPATILGCGNNSGQGHTFTVTFTGGEDAILYKCPHQNNGECVSSNRCVQTVSKASELVAPIFVRENYFFDAWDETIFTISKNTTVSAIWTTRTIFVNFLGNGGRTEDGKINVTVEANSSYQLLQLAPVFLYEGHEGKWDKEIATITNNCDVNVIWTAKESTLSFYDQDQKIEDDMTVTYGNLVGELPEPTKDGYKFVGWKNEEGVYLENGTLWNKMQSERLYAEWTDEENYVIRYDLDGGICGDNVYTYSDQDESIAIKDPEKEGSEFAGWTINGGQEIYQSSQITKSLLDGDALLKANWRGYFLTFDTDGGEITYPEGITDGKVEVIPGQALPELPVVEKAGYKFTGWYNGGKMYSQGDVWDQNGSAEMQARYEMVYTVVLSLAPQKFTTKLYVSKYNIYEILGREEEEITFSVMLMGDIPAIDGQTDFDVVDGYTITVPVGKCLADCGVQTLPVILMNIDASKTDEYNLNGWNYVISTNSKKAITTSTVFDAQTFGDLGEDRVIVITPFCTRIWSPDVQMK